MMIKDRKRKEVITVMNDVVTADLSRFGFVELQDAAELLTAYADSNKGGDFLNDDITLNFNTNSGKVFLSDGDYNVGVMEDGNLVQFFSCPQCGFEGTQYEAVEEGKDFDKYQGYCSQECFDKNK